MGLFNRILTKTLHVIGKVGHVAKKVGSFVAQNHQHLAPLAHGLAMASGNETTQKITGAMLAGSQLASGIENHVKGRIDAMRAQHTSSAPVLGVPVGKYS